MICVCKSTAFYVKNIIIIIIKLTNKMIIRSLICSPKFYGIITTNFDYSNNQRKFLKRYFIHIYFCNILPCSLCRWFFPIKGSVVTILIHMFSRFEFLKKLLSLGPWGTKARAFISDLEIDTINNIKIVNKPPFARQKLFYGT